MTEETKVPGIAAGHQIITPTCRANRGVLGAWVEAGDRLTRLYNDYARAEGNEGVNWHLVLVREEPAKAEGRASSPSGEGQGMGETETAWLVEWPAGAGANNGPCYVSVDPELVGQRRYDRRHEDLFPMPDGSRVRWCFTGDPNRAVKLPKAYAKKRFPEKAGATFVAREHMWPSPSPQHGGEGQ